MSFLRLTLVVVFCFLNIRTAAGADGSPSEYQVKAVFLFNFAKFVDWPESAFSAPDAPFVIGVVGENPFGEALAAAVKGETVKGRRLVLKRFPNADSVTNCHVLFISRSEQQRIPLLLGKLGNAPVLTVADSDGFTAKGGMINFVMRANNVHFDISRDAAEKAGLKINARLLALPKSTGEHPRVRYCSNTFQNSRLGRRTDLECKTERR